MKRFILTWGDGYFGTEEKPEAEYITEEMVIAGDRFDDEFKDFIKSLKGGEAKIYSDPSGVVVVARVA